jgi:hypothetical protein
MLGWESTLAQGDIVMNIKQIEQHVPILGWLHLVGGAFFVVIGLFVFTVLTGLGIAVAPEDPVAPRILILIGTAVCTLLVVLGLPGIVAGYGLLKRRPWARGLAFVVGVLCLFYVPIGTAIGIYTLLVLMP